MCFKNTETANQIFFIIDKISTIDGLQMWFPMQVEDVLQIRYLHIY